MLPWLSTWLFNPWLAAGAAAVASPILIHLLSRRRFRRVRWGAMDFLMKAHQKNRRRVRMEQLILLALRCLAVVLLALMVARPFIRPGLAAAILGAAPRTERIIVLDDSVSMMYAGGGRPTFETAVSAVQRVARWIGSDMPGDALTLILTSKPGAPLVALPSLSEANLQQLEDKLRELRPGQRAAQPARAMQAVADLVSQQPTQTNTTVYVVSDFQRVDWLPAQGITASSPATQPQRMRSPVAALADAGGNRTDISLVLLDVSAPNPLNVAITNIRPMARQAVAGVPTRFAVTIANFTDADLSDVELGISLADQALPPVLVPRLAARETRDEIVEVSFPHSGHDYVRVAISESTSGASDVTRTLPGGLALDNQRAWAGPVLTAVDVLIIDGEPSHDNYKDEAYLLRTALRPEGQAFSGNEVRVVEETELDALDLSPFHVVIMANVYRLSDTARKSLERFVTNGGGLAVYVGGEVDAGLYNEMLATGGVGLLPTRLTDIITAPETGDAGGLGFATWDEHHPIFSAFRGPLAELLRRVRFASVFGNSPMVDSTSPSVATGMPTAASAPSDRPVRVLATLDDADHTPLVVERPLGRGRVVFLASTADLDWNTWARDPSYVPFVLELAAYLAREPDSAGWSLVGDPIRCTLDPNKYAPRVDLRVPSDRTNTPIGLDARPSGDGGFAASWDNTEEAGIYRFDLRTTSGEAEPRYVAVDLPPTESDLAPSGETALKNAISDMKVEYLKDLTSLGGDTTAARRELWWPLLIAVIAVLMLEHTLAWWFGSRR